MLDAHWNFAYNCVPRSMTVFYTEWPALEKIWKILEIPGTISNTWNFFQFLRIYLEIPGRKFLYSIFL